MSRIAGVISADASKQLSSLLEDISFAAVAPAEYSTRRFDFPDAAVAWSGREQAGSRYASRGGISVAFDGFFFNCPKQIAGPEWLLDLYERWGFAGALERINGDFAVALYDRRTQELWLGRDRFGLKPLYFARRQERFAFASRPRVLWRLPGISRAPRQEFVGLFAASHYRSFDNCPDKSPYRDIDQLPAGTWLRLRDGHITRGCYWTLQDRGDFHANEEALAERYRELLLDAVGLRLEVSRKRAFTLSGGMDSSSVLAFAVRREGKKQEAFSTTYEDHTYDETAEIKTILSQTVKTWHPVGVSFPDLEVLVARMVEVHDEPVATATWLSHYLLCREVKAAGFPALFGGLGGDELNAGEYEHFFFFFADLAVAGNERVLLEETEHWVNHHDHPVFKKSEVVMREGLRTLVDLKEPGRCRPDFGRLWRYKDALNRDYFNLQSFCPEMDLIFPSYLKNRAHHDLFRETLPCCARAQDRHAESFGIDHLLPFLDHRLVEFMFQVPSSMKIKNGVTKHLLRLAARGIVPEETRTRVKKTGWNAPAHLWFTGRGKQLLLDIVASRSFRERGIYNLSEVERLITEHNRIVSMGEAKENHMMFFWQLLNLELWLRSLGPRMAKLDAA